MSNSLPPHGQGLTRLLCPWDSLVKNTRMGCHFLLQRIFLTQGANPRLLWLLHWQADSLPLSHLGETKFAEPHKGMESEVAQLCQILCDPWTVACQAPPSMRFFRQENWSTLPFHSPADLPNPGLESESPALQEDSLSAEPPGKCYIHESR